jgi:hypothetical protein
MAKSPKRKTHDAVATDTERSSEPVKRPGQSAPVANSDIARRAYELYLARGGEHGHDVDDWLQAERELRAAVSAA